MANWLHPLSLCQMRRKGKVLRTHDPTTTPLANVQTQALTQALHLDGTVVSSWKRHADWPAQIPTWHVFDKNSTQSHTVIPHLLTIFVTPFFTLRRNEKTRYLFSACRPACEQKVSQNWSKWLWQDLNLRQWRLQPKCSALDHSATKSENQVRSGNWTRDHFHPKEVSYP